MNSHQRFDAQAHHDADQIISDARKPYILHALQVKNRRRYGIGFLYEDDDSRALFIAMCALGLPKKQWDSVAPWLKFMSKPEREALEQRIAQFKPTPRNIAVAARLTKEDRKKYGNLRLLVGNKTKRPMQALLQLAYIDGDLDADRRDARNSAQRKRRQEAYAAASKTADPDVERRRQSDREYQQAKRRAEGARPRAEYLAGSMEDAKLWEADDISRRTFWRRRKIGCAAEDVHVAQVRRQQAVAQVRRQQAPRNPLKDWDFVETPYEADPKKERVGITQVLNDQPSSRIVREALDEGETVSPSRTATGTTGVAAGEDLVEGVTSTILAAGEGGACGTTDATLAPEGLDQGVTALPQHAHLARRDGFGVVFNGAPIDPRWTLPMRNIAAAWRRTNRGDAATIGIDLP